MAGASRAPAEVDHRGARGVSRDDTAAPDLKRESARRRARLLAAVVAAGAFVLLLLSGITAWALRERARAETARAEAEHQRDAATRSAYSTQLSHAAELASLDPERAEQLLTATPGVAAMREFAWCQLRSYVHDRLQSTDAGSTVEDVFLLAGDRLLVRTFDGVLRQSDSSGKSIATGRAYRIAATDKAVWATDGREIHQLDASLQAIPATRIALPFDAYALAVSADGSRLAAADGVEAIAIVDPAGRHLSRIKMEERFPHQALARLSLSPDGRWFAFRHRSGFDVVDASRGSVESRFRGNDWADTQAVALGAGGLLAAGGKSQLVLFEAHRRWEACRPIQGVLGHSRGHLARVHLCIGRAPLRARGWNRPRLERQGRRPSRRTPAPDQLCRIGGGRLQRAPHRGRRRATLARPPGAAPGLAISTVVDEAGGICVVEPEQPPRCQGGALPGVIPALAPGGTHAVWFDKGVLVVRDLANGGETRMNIPPDVRRAGLSPGAHFAVLECPEGLVPVDLTRNPPATLPVFPGRLLSIGPDFFGDEIAAGGILVR